MKIGIVTFHNALNAGAVLQAFALQTILSRLGHEVEFINYKPKKKYNIRDFIAKSPIVMLKKWVNIFNGKKYTKLNNFNAILSLSSRSYFSYNDFIKYPMNYDIYIAGSDQIWNFYDSLSPIYMLDFVPSNKKKIAYAASMGQCRLDQALHSSFKNKLLSYSAISLREKNGVNFVNNLLQGKKQVIQTLDPTLLLEANDYNEIMISDNINSQPYICSYILSNLDKDNGEIISYIKEQLNLDILNLRNPDTCIWLRNEKNIIVTPNKWLNYIKKSNFVICSSFHAVVFSIIFNKPFIALVPPECKNKGGNMRINTLLEDTNLLNRIVTNFDKGHINQVINSSINWEEVNKKIITLREPSIEFLKSNLN